MIEQVKKIEDTRCKNDIVSAIKTMSQIESRSDNSKELKFLAWNTSHSDWQQNYKSGGVGSCAWDIACIINRINDAQFSGTFLRGYLRHGGKKPTLTELYANIYYVKVIEAIKFQYFSEVMELTTDIIGDTMFNTDIVSYETLIELGITGY